CAASTVTSSASVSRSTRAMACATCCCSCALSRLIVVSLLPATRGAAAAKAAAPSAETAASKPTATAAPAHQRTEQGAGQHGATLAAARPATGDADQGQHHGEQDQQHQQRWLLLLRRPAKGRQVAFHGFATDHLDHALHPGAKAAGEIALAEGRSDQVVDDQGALRIGQAALQAVADLDANAPLGLGHDQQGAVVLALLADAPLPPQR